GRRSSSKILTEASPPAERDQPVIGARRFGSAQTLLEGPMLLPNPLRQAAAEAAEELLLAPERIAPFGGLHREDALEGGTGQLEAFDIQGLGGRDESDGGFHRAAVALAAPDDPLENAQVVAESGPHVTPLLLPEPVDPEDA